MLATGILCIPFSVSSSDSACDFSIVTQCPLCSSRSTQFPTPSKLENHQKPNSRGPITFYPKTSLTTRTCLLSDCQESLNNGSSEFAPLIVDVKSLFDYDSANVDIATKEGRKAIVAKQRRTLAKKRAREWHTKKYPCAYCTSSFSYESGLKYHHRHECGKEASIKCPYCDYKSKYKTNVTKHVRSNHKSMPVVGKQKTD